MKLKKGHALATILNLRHTLNESSYLMSPVGGEKGHIQNLYKILHNSLNMVGSY